MGFKLRPRTSFLGCFSLESGVLVACGCVIIRSFLALYFVADESTHGTLHASTTSSLGVAPAIEVPLFQAIVSLAGAPLAVLAGIGTIFRFEYHCRNFFFYAVFLWAVDVFYITRTVISGSFCESVIPDYVARLGVGFVCSMLSTQAVFWSLIYFVFAAYLVFILWSHCEMLRTGEYAELVQYHDVDPDAPEVGRLISHDIDHGGLGKFARLSLLPTQAAAAKR